MQAIGDRLREARMRQKIDIAEVEEATKIRAKYLRALENEEFGLLPGSTFVKSFLRTYAQYLGLDAHLLVEEYRAQHEPREEQAELQPFATSSPPPRGRERRVGGGGPSPGLVIAGVLVLIVGGLAILGLTAGEDGDDGSPASDERSDDRRSERGERREREENGRERGAAEVVRVRVVPNEATYVCVDDGRDNVRFEGNLEEPRTFRGRRVRILLGRRGVEVTANGREVPIEAGPDPIAFDFTGSRRREIDQSRAPCA